MRNAIQWNHLNSNPWLKTFAWACVSARAVSQGSHHQRARGYKTIWSHLKDVRANCLCASLRPGKTRKHVSRNTRGARMFPQCFPVLPHGKHCFQDQFCFQEANFASATRQKHFVFPRGMETLQNEETITETCFLVLPGLYCARNSCRNATPCHASSARAEKTFQPHIGWVAVALTSLAVC